MATHAAEWMMARNAACGLARWNGHIQPTQLSTLCREYGVKWPVRIKRSAGTTTLGTHRAEPYITDKREGRTKLAYRHVVTISTYLSVLEANKTLKHELRHALQVEEKFAEGKTPREYLAEYKREGRSGWRYLANRFEVEARESGADHRMPITQKLLVSEAIQQQALIRVKRNGWYDHLMRHVAREAKDGASPAIRAHYSALVLDPPSLNDPDALMGFDAAFTAASQAAWTDLQKRRQQESLQQAQAATEDSGARCVVCHDSYDERRKALGYDTCLKCARLGYR